MSQHLFYLQCCIICVLFCNYSFSLLSRKWKPVNYCNCVVNVCKTIIVIVSIYSFSRLCGLRLINSNSFVPNLHACFFHVSISRFIQFCDQPKYWLHTKKCHDHQFSYDIKLIDLTTATIWNTWMQRNILMAHALNATAYENEMFPCCVL